MNRLSKEEIRYLRYQIYRFRFDNPWITNKKIAELVNLSISTVSRYAKEAEENGVIWNPQPRVKSYPQKKAALLAFTDKHKAYFELQNCPEITYVCIYQGDWNITAIYNTYVDFETISGYERTVAEGIRGTIFTPPVAYTSWESCFEKMEHFLEQSSDIEETNLDYDPEYLEWDDEEWNLYYYFRYNLRKSFNKFKKGFQISWRKYEKWKKTLTKYCTILSSFYPDGYDSYSSLTFCLRTLYEKYIMDLLSLLPTTPVLYKIGEYLSINLYVPRDYGQYSKIFEIMSLLIGKGIITECLDGYAIESWRTGEPG